MKKQQRNMYLIGTVIIIVGIILLCIFYKPLNCKLIGGEWLTLGPVECCEDNGIWNLRVQSCEDSGGNWVMPEFVGAKISDGFCTCPSGTEWILPVGYPCAIGECEDVR